MKKELQQIKEIASEEHVPIMMEDGLQFLLTYLKENEPIQTILEVGTAVGYSAIQMASLRDSIHIDTLEIQEEMVLEARKNIEMMHLEDQIVVHHCDALTFETDQTYDFIFIDAAKAQYRNYLEHFFPNSRKGTIFFFDNLNFHGIVDDPSKSHNRSTLQMTRKIKKFRNWLLVEPRFACTFYPEVGDGVAIAKRVK